MWKVIKVTHYTPFGKSSGYIHTTGQTKLFLFKDGRYEQAMLFNNNQTKYKKGDTYELIRTN